MGRVKARQVKESTIESTIAKAIEEYKSGRKTSIRQAAESQGLAYSTLYGRLKGRLPRQKAHELDQSLGEAEERAIVRQIEDMDRRGFPMRVDHVREMGLWLLSEREGQSRDKVYLGKNWVSRFLDRNPHLTSKFSTQVQKKRIVSSNSKILKQSFEVLGPGTSRGLAEESRDVPRLYSCGPGTSRDNTKVPGLFVHYSAMHKHRSVNYLNLAMISESLTL